MSDTLSPLPHRRLPQFRIAGLLGLMAIVPVVSSLIGAGAIAGLIWAIYLLFPSLVGVLLALFTWRDRRQPSAILGDPIRRRPDRLNRPLLFHCQWR